MAFESVRSYPVCPGFVFTIADYGCADGGTSMSLIYVCVEELRKLHGMSWKSLFIKRISRLMTSLPFFHTSKVFALFNII